MEFRSVSLQHTVLPQRHRRHSANQWFFSVTAVLLWLSMHANEIRSKKKIFRDVTRRCTKKTEAVNDCSLAFV